MSKSKTRGVAAIGNSGVIPAKAGIQVTMIDDVRRANWAPACAGATTLWVRAQS